MWMLSQTGVFLYVLISIWLQCIHSLTTEVKIIIRFKNLAVGEQLPWKLTPKVCVKPRVTERALYLVTLLSLQCLCTKIHFPIILQCPSGDFLKCFGDHCFPVIETLCSPLHFNLRRRVRPFQCWGGHEKPR